MTSSSRLLVAVAVAVLAAACSSSSNGAPATPHAVERVVFSDGDSLHLASFDGQTLVTLATATIPSAGFPANHAIFAVLKHPTRPWLYTTSLSDHESWLHPRIDRFEVGQGTLTWAGLAYDYTAHPEAHCTASCNPVSGEFAPGGTRLYVKNRDSYVDVFRVDPDGAVTLLSQTQIGASVFGIGLDPTGAGTYLYAGSEVLGLAGDAVQVVRPGEGGNSTRYLPRPGDDLLLTTQYTDGIVMYSLAAPADPVLLDSVMPGRTWARAVAMNDATTQVVVVGRNSVATYAWTGSRFTPEASLDPHVGVTNVEHREVAYLSNDTRAAVSWFQTDPRAPSGSVGGVTLYALDPSAITTLGTVRLPGPARAVRVLEL
jgi:hypothetical protein